MGKGVVIKGFCKEHSDCLFNDRLEQKEKGFPGGSEVKVSAYNAGDLGSIPGSGRAEKEEAGRTGWRQLEI